MSHPGDEFLLLEGEEVAFCLITVCRGRIGIVRRTVVWKPLVVSGCIYIAYAPANLLVFRAYNLVTRAGKTYLNLDRIRGLRLFWSVVPWSVTNVITWRSISSIWSGS